MVMIAEVKTGPSPKPAVAERGPVPAGLVGLTTAEVLARAANGETNRPSNTRGRSYLQIVQANVFTRFNAILGALLVIIVLLGPAVDGLFGVILVANAFIGMVQEMRAKRAADSLSIITATKICVLRNGELVDVDTFDVVRGDLVGLRSGSQVIADGTVEASDGLEVDESLITGEADARSRQVGDQLRSGSFVSAGTGWFRAEAVGDKSFANALSDQVRDFVPVQSELRNATDRVLRVVTWAIGPIAAALLIGQRLGGETWRSSVFGAATGVVEIVPEGFVLLTSMTFSLSIVRLGRAGVLVKELAAVEGLARVDVMCIDKTGTLTEGDPEVAEVVAVNDEPLADVLGALEVLTEDATNATGIALHTYLQDKQRNAKSGTLIPFSSARKWAAITTTSSPASTWVMGAPEVVLDQTITNNATTLQMVAERAAGGHRVLVVASTSSIGTAGDLPPDLVAVGLATLKERVRTDSREMLAYFAEQNVAIKVISGDNPVTVAAVASAAGLDGLADPESIVDARTLTEDRSLEVAIQSALVVGRTSPQQKAAMVRALQAQGHVVAMTGDGVNDALALKSANLAIAMGSGSEATKAVAQLVLVDGNFSALPGLVAEGRRVIANVERVAKLFITKTVYAAALALASGVARLPFPFLPRQLTLVSAITIGIPGFFLAFAPDSPPTEPGFLRRVVVFALPAGLTTAAATFAAYAFALRSDASGVEARTTATVVLGLVGIWIVDVLARPLSKWRVVMLSALFALGVSAVAIGRLRRFWSLQFPDIYVVAGAGAIVAAAIAVMEFGWRLSVRHLMPNALTTNLQPTLDAAAEKHATPSVSDAAVS